MASINLAGNVRPPISDKVLNVIQDAAELGNTQNYSTIAISIEQHLRKFEASFASKEKFSLETFCFKYVDSPYSFVSDIAFSYMAKRRVRPHIIIGSNANKAVLKYIKYLESKLLLAVDIIDVEYSPPMVGSIVVERVKYKIQKNTCLISIDAINNSVGVINDLELIGGLANKYMIPFHSDMTSLMGKYNLQPSMNNLDAFSVNFNGICNFRIDIIRKTLVDGYELSSPNKEYSIAAIMGAITEYKLMTLAKPKYQEMYTTIRTHFIKQLQANFEVLTIDQYRRMQTKKITLEDLHKRCNKTIVMIVGDIVTAENSIKIVNSIPSTVLISVYYPGIVIEEVYKKMKQSSIDINICKYSNGEWFDDVKKLELDNLISCSFAEPSNTQTGKTTQISGQLDKFIHVLQTQ
jgi:hypothetical protein